MEKFVISSLPVQGTVSAIHRDQEGVDYVMVCGALDEEAASTAVVECYREWSAESVMETGTWDDMLMHRVNIKFIPRKGEERDYVDSMARASALKPGDIVRSPIMVDEPIAFILSVTEDRGFGWIEVTFMDAITHEVSKDRVSVGIKFHIRSWNNS